MKKEKTSLLPLMLLAVIFSDCSPSFPSQNPAKIDITWSLLRNVTDNDPSFLASLTIKNNAEFQLDSKDWRIYFNLRYHGASLRSTSPEFKISHVSGELFYLTPSDRFKGLPPGRTVTLKYEGEETVANFQDIPSGMFYVKDSLDDNPVSLKNPAIAEALSAKLPTADPLAIFKKNERIHDIADNNLPAIFPTPSLYAETGEKFTLTEKTIITGDAEFEHEARLLNDDFSKIFGYRLTIQNKVGVSSIIFKKQPLPTESYHLKIDNNQILIEASDATGIFYGMQSLKTMIPGNFWKESQGSFSFRGIDVHDAPRFPVRAFMLDVARNFQPKEEIFKILDIMALYKLNVFHFHLTDDEGWRLEIPGLPELTTVGSNRGYPFDNNYQLHPSYGSGTNSIFPGSGFYSRQDYVEIVKFANARHIRIIPELESPGHARAAIKAMQYRYDKYLKEGFDIEASRYLLSESEDRSKYMSNQFFSDNVMNAALPSTYAFVEKVIDEIVSMHQDAGAPLTAIHMAGDEVPLGVWEKSPAVKAFLEDHPTMDSTSELWTYYFEQVKAILRKRGLAIQGYQELVVGAQTKEDGEHLINTDLLSDDLQINAWWTMNGNEDIPYKLANTGYKTVIANFDHFYFDLAYEENFNEPGDAGVGFLDVERIFGFIPFDYYRNISTDVRGNPLPKNFFAGKDKLNEKSKHNIVGMQGSLWGENIVSTELMEYLLIPRLLALAERNWSPDPAWVQDLQEGKTETYQQAWSTFANVLGKHELPRLNYYAGGINYRIPTPGASIIDGNVVANIEFPGFHVRYTTDGTDPEVNSQIYSSPIGDKKQINFRAFDPSGRASRMITIMNE